MTLVTYVPSDAYPTISGATMSYGSGQLFDIKAALTGGGGSFVVDDVVNPSLVGNLDRHPAVKRSGTAGTVAPSVDNVSTVVAHSPNYKQGAVLMGNAGGDAPSWVDYGPPIATRMLLAMEADDRDVSFLIIGDSTSGYVTSADTFKWPYLMLNAIAARFPKYTVKYLNWTGTFFIDIATVQTGTGTHTLRMYNASWGGVGTRFQLGSNFDRLMATVTPNCDLVLVSHGHNNGTGSVADPSWRDDLLALTESINLKRPGAEIVVIAQNPRTPVPSADYQEALQHETLRVAQMRGYGFINAWRAFQDASPNGITVSDPTAGSLIFSDTVHPNVAGQTLWANTILKRLFLSHGYAPNQQPSSLSTPISNRLANGDFAAFASPPTLTSWTATNAVLSKDVTNFESGNSYSVKITPSSAAASFISQSLASVKEVLGQYVTVGARIFATSAVKSGSSTSGRVSLVETGGSTAGETLSTASVDGSDGFLWITTSRLISYDATGLAVRVYGDSGSVSTSVISVDRVVIARGMLPRDIR